MRCLERLCPHTALVTVAMLVCAASVEAGTTVVQLVGITFDPEVIEVAPGDTIRWEWQDEFHTVTSGTDCMPDGVHFNQILIAGSPIFEYTVPEDFIGSIPYYCAPHCLFDMVGVINVGSSACPSDLDKSGDVGFEDLVSVLTAWGPCEEGTCPADLDGNGDVGFGDLLLTLGAWGPCA